MKSDVVMPLIAMVDAADMWDQHAMNQEHARMDIIHVTNIMRTAQNVMDVIHGEAMAAGKIVNQPVVEIIHAEKGQYIIKMSKRHLFFTHLNKYTVKTFE